MGIAENSKNRTSDEEEKERKKERQTRRGLSRAGDESGHHVRSRDSVATGAGRGYRDYL